MDFSAGSDVNSLSLSLFLAGEFEFPPLFFSTLLDPASFWDVKRNSRQLNELPTTTNREWAGRAYLSHFYSTIVSCDRSLSLSLSLSQLQLQVHSQLHPHSLALVLVLGPPSTGVAVSLARTLRLLEEVSGHETVSEHVSLRFSAAALFG